MKIIKYLLFVILILFIAGSILVATKDGDFFVTSSRLIKAPASLVHEEIADLSNWKTWEGWQNQQGIAMEVGQDTPGPGATITWDGKDLKDGKITTTSVIPDRELKQELQMETITGTSQAQITWTLTPTKEGVLVKWKLSGSLTFKEKLAFSLQDKDLAEIFQPIFEASLPEIEEDVLRKMEVYSIHVDGITSHGGGYYMYTATAARLGEVGTKAWELLEGVRAFMKTNEMAISGKPMVIYNQRDEQSGTTIFSAAVPTPDQVVTPRGSDYLNGYLKPQKVLKTTLRGHHKNTLEAWKKAYAYMEANGLEVDPRGQAFESYLTSPKEVENPARWITAIYIPVRK